MKTLLLCTCFFLMLNLVQAEKEGLINGVAATVNNRAITYSEIRNAVMAQMNSLRTQYSGEELQQKLKEIQQESLEDLIEKALILDAFAELEKKGRVQLNPQAVEEDINFFIRRQFDGDRNRFLNELQANGLSIHEFRKIRREATIVNLMRNSQYNKYGNISVVTPIEIEKEYQQNKHLFQQEGAVKLWKLSIPKGDAPEKQKELAQQILEKIKQGAEFSDMAKQHSSDPKAEEGGYWGWVKRNTFKPFLANVAFSLEANGLSDIIEGETSYTILYVEERQKEETLPLSNAAVREQIKRMVLQKKQERTHDRWIADLKKKAVIHIY